MIAAGCSNNSLIYGDKAITNDFVNFSAKESKYSFSDVVATDKMTTLATAGDNKVLVIPIALKGYETNKTDKILADLNKTFNGEASDTSWQSVKSYYKTSSYGKQNLSFTISSWYDSGLTPQELYAKQGAKNTDGGTWYLMNAALSWYKTNNSTTCQDFDKDKDGYIDALWFVYNCPYYTKENKLQDTFWAFQFRNFENKGKNNANSPIGYNYAWASYIFMYGKYGANGLDSHTYIHETGHLQGVDDYYDTTGKTSPTGKIDMMDYNLGDHNGYTKFAYQWSKPYVVTGNCNISLRSFTEYGDSILLSPQYNGSAFEEYILIQLYTPTGLNEKDSKEENIGPRTYSKPGISIYHVNARMMAFDEDGKSTDYVTTITDNQLVQIVETNSTNTQPFPLLNMIEKGGEAKGLTSNTIFTDNDLFYSHDTFTLSSYENNFKDGKLDSGLEFKVKVEIGTLNNSFANIAISF